VTRRTLLSAALLAVALLCTAGAGSARAQDWTDYLHWPYVPPQYPGNGFEYNALHDGWYLYPREQRIVPQIQGKYYHNYYGGKRVLGMRLPPWWFHEVNKMKFYEGYHFFLDVF
jgi:hypothetical protein